MGLDVRSRMPSSGGGGTLDPEIPILQNDGGVEGSGNDDYSEAYGAGGGIIGPLCDVGGPVAVECNRIQFVDGFGRSGVFSGLERMNYYSNRVVAHDVTVREIVIKNPPAGRPPEGTIFAADGESYLIGYLITITPVFSTWSNVNIGGDKVIVRREKVDASNKQNKKIKEAKDAVEKILGEDTDCAKLFGDNALEAFRSIDFAVGELFEFSPNNSEGIKNASVGISGRVGFVDQTARKNGYLSSSSLVINVNGSFFNSSIFVNTRTGVKRVDAPRFGGYRGGKLKSRVLQLLHELGHIVLTSEGEPLLPDDGGNESLSEKNTKRITDKCKDEIEAL